MGSTGEIASFGKDIYDAYWAALLSQTNFKVPKLGSGVLLGGDVSRPEFTTVVKRLSDLGFELYCATAEVERFANSVPYARKCERIVFPTRDKRKLRASMRFFQGS